MTQDEKKKKENTLQQSESSDDPYSPERAIRAWQLRATPKYFYYLTDSWMSPPHLYIREVIQKYGLENDPRVIKADQEILRLAFKNYVAPPDFAQLDGDPPLEYWWYYLDDIHRGEYPLDLLPDHLRDIYREHLKKLGKLT